MKLMDITVTPTEHGASQIMFLEPLMETDWYEFNELCSGTVLLFQKGDEIYE